MKDRSSNERYRNRFIVNPEGYILTNEQVIRYADDTVLKMAILEAKVMVQPGN